MKKFIELLVVVLLLISCGDKEKESLYTQKVNLTTNSEVSIEKNVLIKTKYVIDHRRPVGSTSSRNGDATVKIRIYNGHVAVDTAITTGYPNTIVVNGYRITLDSVLPYPEINVLRKQSDYEIRITLEKID